MSDSPQGGPSADAHTDFAGPELTILDASSRLLLFRVLSATDARAWMDALLQEVPLEQRAISLFGKTLVQPRLIGWAGDMPYTYSRQTLPPRPVAPTLAQLLRLTQRVTGHAFNHALLNYYRDGQDSMGMHSDDEAELGKNPVIASWSLGAERTFLVAEKRGKRRLRLRLSSGCLLVMEGATQHGFRHGVPKVNVPTEPRLNITFRNILRSSPGLSRGPRLAAGLSRRRSLPQASR